MRLDPKLLPWLKALLHLAAGLPLLYLALQVVTDSAGGDPVQYIIHFTGKGALNVLVATLLVSPVARKFKLGFFDADPAFARTLGICLGLLAYSQLFQPGSAVCLGAATQ